MGKMAQFTSDMVEKTTVVLRVGSVVLHPGTSLKKGPFVDSGILLQTPSRHFHMLLDAKPNVDLFWDEIMKVKIESPPSLQPDAIDPRKSVKEHRFHDVWSVSGYQSLSTSGFQFLS